MLCRYCRYLDVEDVEGGLESYGECRPSMRVQPSSLRRETIQVQPSFLTISPLMHAEPACVAPPPYRYFASGDLKRVPHTNVHVNLPCPLITTPHSKTPRNYSKNSCTVANSKDTKKFTHRKDTKCTINQTDDTLRSKKPEPHTEKKTPLKIHDGIANISEHQLTEHETSLLKKGLSFVPTPLKVLSTEHEKTLEELRLRYKNRYSLPTRSERLIDCSFKAISYDLDRLRILQPIQNLSKAERKALYRLKKNKDIIITKIDKGDTTVVMDTSHHVELAQQHLSDPNTYQLLTEDPTQEVVTRFNQYILNCKQRGVISQWEFEKLYLPENTSTQTIYFLPKLHKNPLKLRPIISLTQPQPS